MSKKKRRWTGLIAGAAVLLLIFGMTVPFLARGLWDESRAVHIKPEEIESSTFAIGTHLVHLSALNDSIYEIAQASAEESGQDGIYYKSELGGDAWFNISSASTLEDITTGGTPVTDDEMAQLFFTHHTKSDKKTYDLRTGRVVNIFDIRDPYDLESLDELSPLKMQYDTIREGQGKNELTDRIDKIWETEIVSAVYEGTALVTSQLEAQLDALQIYLDVLNERGADARETGMVSDVMAALDASRRYVVFATLEPILSAYLQELNTAAAEAEGEEEEEKDEPPAPGAELISAAAESQGNVQDAMITTAGEMLAQGTTIMSIVEYELSMRLVRDAESSNHSACDQDVKELIHLDNINQNVISSRLEELALLDSTLLPRATDHYTSLLAQGPSAQYRAEKAKGSPQAILDRLIGEYEGDLNSRRGELEFLMEAKTIRLDTAGAAEFVEGLLDEMIAASGDVPGSDVADAAQSSLEGCMDALTDKLRALELAAGGNEMDRLTKQKEELQNERLDALDNNDLARAKELEDQLNQLEDQIRGLEAESAAQIAQLQEKINALTNQLAADPGNSDLQSQLANAKADLSSLENSLSDGSMGAAVAQLKDQALDAIKDPENSAEGALTSAVEGLAELLSSDPGLVLPALQEVHDELVLNGGPGSDLLVDLLEQAILDHPNALSGQLTAEQLKAIINGQLQASGAAPGNTFGTVSGEDGIVVLIALQEYYGQTGNDASLTLISGLSQRLLGLGDPRIFERINDSTGEYIPLTAVQAVTGRRFVWNKNASLGVLARGSDYYGFTLYSSRVLRDRDGLNTEEMARIAKNLGGIHIPEEYATQAFGASAVYLSGTNLGCAFTDAMADAVQTMLDSLLAG